MVRGILITDVSDRHYIILCANRAVRKMSLRHFLADFALKPHKVDYQFKSILYENIPLDDEGYIVADKCDIILQGGFWNTDDFLTVWNSECCIDGLEVE